jgi:hypothetical protein
LDVEGRAGRKEREKWLVCRLKQEFMIQDCANHRFSLEAKGLLGMAKK